MLTDLKQILTSVKMEQLSARTDKRRDEKKREGKTAPPDSGLYKYLLVLLSVRRESCIILTSAISYFKHDGHVYLFYPF